MTNTPDKSEMKAIERVERRLNNAWAKHGFMTLTVSDLREVVSLARAPSRPADQVPDMVERVARALSIPQYHTGWDDLPETDKDLFYMQADYAIAALQAVPASGEEPTQAMVEAGCQQWTSWGHAEPIESVVKRIYAAMRAASGEE